MPACVGIAAQVYSYLKRGGCVHTKQDHTRRPPLFPSTLRDRCVQHLPDGSVTVESILVQAAAHSEDPGTKVLLVSWTYQVGSGQRVLVACGVWPVHSFKSKEVNAPSCLHRMKSWGATSHHCSRRACPRPLAEALHPGPALLSQRQAEWHFSPLFLFLSKVCPISSKNRTEGCSRLCTPVPMLVLPASTWAQDWVVGGRPHGADF